MNNESRRPRAPQRAGYPHTATSAGVGPTYRPRPLVGGVSSEQSRSSVPRVRSAGGGRKEIFCAFGVDVDAVAGWLGSYGGEDSPCDISRGLFSGEVGVPRLVRLFDKLAIPTSWFIPGHSIETFPEQCRMVVDAGHEIGVHGYSHENPIAMTPSPIAITQRAPNRSMYRRMRFPWLAISSIIFRLVWLNQ